MLGLTPVPEGHAWLDNLVRVYLPAREYLGPFEAVRGRVFDRDAWIRVLLARFPAEEYLCQLAILNHAADLGRADRAVRGAVPGTHRP